MHSLATLIGTHAHLFKVIHTNHVPELQCMKTYRYRSGASEKGENG